VDENFEVIRVLLSEGGEDACCCPASEPGGLLVSDSAPRRLPDLLGVEEAGDDILAPAIKDNQCRNEDMTFQPGTHYATPRDGLIVNLK
jgi:hypothetical protein